MKNDVDVPPRPPKKRKALKQALDLWLAVWANDEALSRADRDRAEAERTRRKMAQRDVVVVVLIPREGLTPIQKHTIKALMEGATEVRRWVSGSAPYQGVVRGAELVIAAPKEGKRPARPPDGSVWAAERYARDRGCRTVVVLADGTSGKE